MQVFVHVEPGFTHLNMDDAKGVLDYLLRIESIHQLLTLDHPLAETLLDRGRRLKSISFYTNVADTARANVTLGERMNIMRCHGNMADVRAIDGAHNAIFFYGDGGIIKKLAERGSKVHPVLFPETKSPLFDGEKWHLILVDWSEAALRALWNDMGWTKTPSFVVPHGITNLDALDLSSSEHVS